MAAGRQTSTKEIKAYRQKSLCKAKKGIRRIRLQLQACSHVCQTEKGGIEVR